MKMPFHRLSGFILFLLLPGRLLAGDPGEFEGVSGLMSMMLSLMVVLAVIFAIAWGMRRMQGFTGARDPHMAVIGQMALSTKERLMLVEVGGQQLLLGVSPAGIRTLHVLEEPVESPSSQDSGSFRDRLMETLGRGEQSAAHPGQTDKGGQS